MLSGAQGRKRKKEENECEEMHQKMLIWMKDSNRESMNYDGNKCRLCPALRIELPTAP